MASWPTHRRRSLEQRKYELRMKKKARRLRRQQAQGKVI